MLAMAHWWSAIYGRQLVLPATQGPIQQGGQPPNCMRKQVWQVPLPVSRLRLCSHLDAAQPAGYLPAEEPRGFCISRGCLCAVRSARTHFYGPLPAEQQPCSTYLIVPHSQHDACPGSAGSMEPQIVCFGGSPALLILWQLWGVEAAACNRQRHSHRLLQCLVAIGGSCQRHGKSHVHSTRQDMARQGFEVCSLR